MSAESELRWARIDAIISEIETLNAALLPVLGPGLGEPVSRDCLDTVKRMERKTLAAMPASVAAE